MPEKKVGLTGWRGIGLILLLAAALRILGIWHSYPFSYYGDEVHFVERALSFGTLDFNPHWFHKPALYMYILFAEFGLFFVLGKLAGAWASIADFATAYIANPGPFFLLGRGTTVAFGVGTVWLVFRMGDRHFDREVGLLAALLLALTPGHVVASQFVKADAPTTFFTVVSMYFLLEFLKTRTVRHLVAASVFAGVGAATKYYSLVMLLPIAIAAAVVAMEESSAWLVRLKRLVATAVVAVLSFWLAYFVCSPYNFLDPLGRRDTFGWLRKLGRSFNRLMADGGGGGSATAAGETNSWWAEPLDFTQVLLASEGMGLVIGTLGIAGLAFVLARPNKQRVVFLSFPLAFIAGSLYIMSVHVGRHQLPLHPFLAVCGALLVMTVARRMRARWVVFGALTLALTQPLYGIARHGIRISRTDTRNLAKTWIEANIRAGTKLVVDEEGPRLMKTPENLQQELDRAVAESQSGQFTAHYDTYLEYQIAGATRSVTYDIFEIRFPWWRKRLAQGGVQHLTTEFDRDYGNPLKPVGVESYDHYLGNGYEYAVVQSGRYGRWMDPADGQKEAYPGYAEFYQELFARGRSVKEFDPAVDDRPGPTVKIMAFQ